jgi:arsenate reductase
VSGKPLKILFLCTGNSCRSQMAEGWARHLKGGGIEAWSAGLIKHGLNPYAVQVMAEAGVDISGQYSKTIEELPPIAFDYVITLCDHAHESCPYFPGKILHRGFPDPPTMALSFATPEEKLACFRQVRDQIRDFILTLPKSLIEQ